MRYNYCIDRTDLFSSARVADRARFFSLARVSHDAFSLAREEENEEKKVEESRRERIICHYAAYYACSRHVGAEEKSP